jgi:hypothetical protein
MRLRPGGLSRARLNFIARDALLQFLREYGEVALRVAEQLNGNYYI